MGPLVQSECQTIPDEEVFERSGQGSGGPAGTPGPLEDRLGMVGFTVGEKSSHSGEHDAYPGPAVTLNGVLDKVR